jgi:cyclohexyl-isocyanide hydratase
MSHDLLPAFGAIPVAERVVVDGNLTTGGGVTAGIDVALTVVAEIAGRAAAEAIQLAVEYDPAPQFAAGSPETAPPAVLHSVLARGAARQQDRAERVTRAAALIGP